MNYLSTRNNHPPVSASMAITLGMVPEGGLFVPETVPVLSPVVRPSESYQSVARRILSTFLTDFSENDLDRCIASAYTPGTFDSPGIAPLVPLDINRSILELWHGPTAAFKDIALQIMPHFLATAKKNIKNASRTVILVATSGDTGKAALEGFRDRDGISLIVFFPYKGVSEIQELQMTTTTGSNTYVAAVRGNFDDCQNEVKRLLGSSSLREYHGGRGFEFSSANSINWGRLCPQIVYYWTAYTTLVARKTIKNGDKVDFCVPTGNFGNILAGYYAKRMGLPIGKLICASNKNNVLTDFFATGAYNSNRTFHRTLSPSMDILISSNLERFLFEVTGHDAGKVSAWAADLGAQGSFIVDPATHHAMEKVISAVWIDEEEVLATIGTTFKSHNYVLDTHTAVAAAAGSRFSTSGRHTVIVSTASPYKFSNSVLTGMTGESSGNEFESVGRIARLSGLPVHRALADLKTRPVLHTRVIDRESMETTLEDIIKEIRGKTA